MQLRVKTPESKEITLEVPKPQPLLRLAQQRLSTLFFGISNEVFFMILSWVYPIDIIVLALSCKTLCGLCSEDFLWRNYVGKNHVPWLLKEKENLMECYSRHMAVLKKLEVAWNHVKRFQMLDLNPGITEEEIAAAEKRLAFKLPVHLRTSFMLYNGQDKYKTIASFKLSPIGRFLPLHEVVEFINLSQLPFTDDGNLLLIPFTAESGFQQWYCSMDGSIYLKAGWNATKKAENFVEFLFSLCA